MMQETIDLLAGYAFARQAMVAAVAVGVVCSLLSVVVVLKRMAFVGQGISHAGFGGIGTALLLGITAETWGGYAQPLFILVFCLIVACVIAALSRRKRVETDTAIGILLVAAMAWGVFMDNLRMQWHAAPTPASYHALLFGSILNVGSAGMWQAVVVAAVVVLICALLFKEIVFYTFDENASRVFGVRTGAIHYLLLALLSATIVVTIKLAGFVLVSALLVIPAATALQLSRRLGTVLMVSVIVGLVGTVGGLVLSFEMGDFSTGACMVAVLCALFAAAYAVRSVTGRAGASR